jgi:glycosyltransferase involved in cell wall biosynthesis
MPENIGFISTRFGGTDGVSLESAKWAEALWEDRHVSYWYAGQLDRAPDISMCIPEAYFHHSENAWINQRVWGTTRRSALVTRRINELADYLKGTLYRFVEQFDINILIIENALTIPMHIPLGIAITQFLTETEIPAIAHHHDFYWERSRFQVSAVNDYLEMAFPARIPRLQHVVINQAAREDLAWRKGVPNTLIPNVLDFHTPPPPSNGYAADIRGEMGLSSKDRLVLHPTRVVPRKGIEHAITLLRKMNDPRSKLVLSHESGDEGVEYHDQIRELAMDEGVELLFFGDRVGERRQYDSQGRKVFVLEDIYPQADLVTFTSLYEGFGNALLEAIYYRVPIVVNRYSVFVRDIEPKGFRIPAIDGLINRNVVKEVHRIFDDLDYRRELLDHNYEVAKRYYSYEVLRYGLQKLIKNIHDRTY